jgi:hypothetical protein
MYIIGLDFQMLKQLYIPEICHKQVEFITLFVICRIPFVSIWLKVFVSRPTWNIDLVLFPLMSLSCFENRMMPSKISWEMFPPLFLGRVCEVLKSSNSSVVSFRV